MMQKVRSLHNFIVVAPYVPSHVCKAKAYKKPMACAYSPMLACLLLWYFLHVKQQMHPLFCHSLFLLLFSLSTQLPSTFSSLPIPHLLYREPEKTQTIRGRPCLPFFQSHTQSFFSLFPKNSRKTLIHTQTTHTQLLHIYSRRRGGGRGRRVDALLPTGTKELARRHAPHGSSGGSGGGG